MAAKQFILMLMFAIYCCSVANSNPQYYTELLHQIQPQYNLFEQFIPQLSLPTTTHTQYSIPSQLYWPYQEPSPRLSTLSPLNFLPSSSSPTRSISNKDNIFLHSFESAEFVPLEAQQQQQQQHRQHNGLQVGRTQHSEKPFEVDVITSDVNGDHSQLPGIFFQQAFPFLGNSFFNSFGGFGIGTQQEPWWKGPNVCTEKEEDEKVIDENDENDEAATVAEGTEIAKPQSYFGQFQFSMNSCVEKPNKYVCKRIVNKDGRKKTLTITRQCCHGYGRPRNAAYATPCEKIEIKDIEATASDMGAKEFIVKAKNSGLSDMITNRRNYTIFMPIDDVFNNDSDLLQSESNLVESQTDDSMKQLFLRHIVDGEVNLEDIRNEQLLKTKVDGQNIRINSYQVPLPLSSEPYRYTANCVPIVKHNKLAEQGIIHTLDGIMKTVDKNLMDIIRERKDLSIMRTVLEKTNLNKLLEGDKPMTIFVPTDAAFEKLEPHLRRALKEGKGCASNILKNHMLDLTFCSVASVPGARTTAYNLLGEPMRFNRSKLTDEQKEESEQQGKVQPIIINGATHILEADIMGTNGVMHVIDNIMPTETALPLSSLMQQKNITLFMRLLEASGLDNKFDDMDNLTVFAPTDNALENSKWAKLLDGQPEQLKGNQELNDFISYHVAQPMIKTCDLKEQLLSTVNGKNLRVNLYSTHSLFTNVMNRATVNCARLVNFDDESCGSVLHQVDKPLAPPQLNLLEMLESNPNYSKFLELVQAANLTDILSNSEQDYTLLVPKNDVFDELDENVSKNPTELENLIKTHIVNDVICCAGIVPTNWPFVRTIESLNGHHLRVSRERRPKIQNAGITKCDAIATNGIIHEINDIVVPPSRQHTHQQQPRPSTHFTHSSPDDIFTDIFF